MVDQEAEAAKALKAMRVASETVRSAIASAIPVANTQVLTVSMPGTVINYQNYIYNALENITVPLPVRVAEARLVDGMIPLSRFTTGKTGKSVARSYLAALDFLMPVEASVSGIIGSENPAPTDGRLKIVRDRYLKAMEYLKSVDDTPGGNGRSKLTTYVQKQEAWSKTVESYSAAQDRAITAVKPGANAPSKEVDAARAAYLQWIQEHGRDFKHAIQAKYMDWVVHGYKFMIDYNFGIVDISSGMARIENSKEAFRNLTLVAEDGFSEYSGVILSPSHWATLIEDKVKNWNAKRNKPTASEIRAEIRRLKNLLVSHNTLNEGIEGNAIFPVFSANTTDDDNDKKLKQAYANVYSDMEAKNQKTLTTPVVEETNKTTWLDKYKTPGDTPKTAPAINGSAGATANGTTNSDAGEESAPNPFADLVKAQSTWNENSLSRNKNTVRSSVQDSKDAAKLWIKGKVDVLNEEIKALELKLPKGGKSDIMDLSVVDENGVVITDDDRKANPALLERPVPAESSFWTRVSCNASSTTDIKETETKESASAIAAKLGFGLWSASGGAAHTQSSAKAMSSMSNLSVEISMDCMVVEIERPWLRAELFSDAEIDSGPFRISPGEMKLKEMYENNIIPEPEFQQFSSFPTAFVVAADIELSFSGDTTALESAVSASSTSANVSVGYGPFSVSASHSQSKSASKTKMQSTATGCKISVQAPQIIGWVQTLLPQLPRDTSAPSRMVGLKI